MILTTSSPAGLSPTSPDQPRPKADILAKTYLTKEIETEARSVMKSEGIGMSALLRKALVSYLDSHSKRAGLAV